MARRSLPPKLHLRMRKIPLSQWTSLTQDPKTGYIYSEGWIAYASGVTRRYVFPAPPPGAEGDPDGWMNNMKTIDSEVLGANLPGLLQEINDDHEPVVVTCKKQEPVVVISHKVWRALEEAASMLANPKDARRLRDAVRRLDRGAQEGGTGGA